MTASPTPPLPDPATAAHSIDDPAAANRAAANRAAADLRATGTSPVTLAADPRPAAEPSLGSLVHDASTHVSTLIRSEIALAKLELRSSVKNAGTGIGLFAAAAVVLVFSLVFAFLTLAEGLAALGLARWFAFLIVFLVQLLIVGLFAFLGIRKVKRVKAPQQTIRTTKETVSYLTHARS